MFYPFKYCLIISSSFVKQVKFADKASTSPQVTTPEEMRFIPSEITNAEFINLGMDLCACFLQSIIKSNCADYLSPLSSLVKILNSSEIYSNLAKSVGMTKYVTLHSVLDITKLTCNLYL